MKHRGASLQQQSYVFVRTIMRHSSSTVVVAECNNERIIKIGTGYVAKITVQLEKITRPKWLRMMSPPAPPNLSFVSYDTDLWPPGPLSWSFHALTMWTTCANCHQNRFFSFPICRVHQFGKDERQQGRTNGQTNMKTYASACQCGLTEP